MNFKITLTLIFAVCRCYFVFGQTTQGIVINNVVLPYKSDSLIETPQENNISDIVRQISNSMDLAVLNTNMVRMLQLAI